MIIWFVNYCFTDVNKHEFLYSNHLIPVHSHAVEFVNISITEYYQKYGSRKQFLYNTLLTVPAWLTEEFSSYKILWLCRHSRMSQHTVFCNQAVPVSKNEHSVAAGLLMTCVMQIKMFHTSPKAEKILKPAIGEWCIMSPYRNTYQIYANPEVKAFICYFHYGVKMQCLPSITQILHIPILSFRVIRQKHCYFRYFLADQLDVLVVLFSTVELEWPTPSSPAIGRHMKLLPKITPLICIFSFFLSFPRLLKITYFHLDIQLPSCINFTMIDTVSHLLLFSSLSTVTCISLPSYHRSGHDHEVRRDLQYHLVQPSTNHLYCPLCHVPQCHIRMWYMMTLLLSFGTEYCGIHIWPCAMYSVQPSEPTVMIPKDISNLPVVSVLS